MSIEAAARELIMPAIFCGKCLERYERPGMREPAYGAMIGQPELEGIFFEIGGKRIEGTDLNICTKCAFKALIGRKPFRRKGDTVTIINPPTVINTVAKSPR